MALLVSTGASTMASNNGAGLPHWISFHLASLPTPCEQHMPPAVPQQAGELHYQLSWEEKHHVVKWPCLSLGCHQSVDTGLSGVFKSQATGGSWLWH